MQTRTSRNWRMKPGGFDALHTEQLFPTDGNPYDIPAVPHAPLSYTPEWLTPYRTRIRAGQGMAGGAVHFFLDDYRFETTWSRPNKALQYLRDFRTLLSPDFSLYADWPTAIQIWNVYRSRWCSAYWASLGFQVIPTVSWAERKSYDFCFVGIAQRSMVAVSSVGVRPSEQNRFVFGYRKMVERLQPSRVLCYGTLPASLETVVEVQCYPTRWDGITQARRNGR
ncbi:MAG: DUF4417 domain-containing protein [Aggregatilineales bacterium]